MAKVPSPDDSAPRSIAISLPDLGEEEWQATREPIFSGWVTQGPQVAAFEAAFAARVGRKHAVANANGTTSLHLALAAMGVGKGDEVIVPAFTWVATANAVVFCGAKPVFADVSPETMNIDPATVAKLVSSRTKAVIPVHLFGLCADMAAVARAAPGIPLLEDAACAAGAALGGRPAGSLGKAAAFSFHPRKSITTGEGGMVVTDDEGLAERVRSMRTHGAASPPAGTPAYKMAAFVRLGFNYRMTDIQAAIGLVQLKKLDRLIDERAAGARYYHEHLAGIPWLRLPSIGAANDRHGWQSYVLMVDPARAPAARDDLMARLLQAGIQTRPGTHAVTMLDYYQREHGTTPAAYPGAKLCQEQSLAIPLHTKMSRDDYAYVVAQIRALG